MGTSEVHVLLATWREADRRWEATARDDPGFRGVCVDVVRAWVAYHAAVDDQPPGEIALVADDERVYVAVSRSVQDTLGYAPESVLGRRIEDLAAPAAVPTTRDQWAGFVKDGRQDGAFDMLRSDGTVLRMRYQARAHYPIANFHLSRLWPEPEANGGRHRPRVTAR